MMIQAPYLGHLGNLAIIFVAALAACAGVNAFWASRRHARQARVRGCRACPSFPTKYPGGIDVLVRLAQADQRDRIPQETRTLHQEGGRPTYRQTVLGQTNIVTNDPKNIQAVLATQFHDFELGPRRRNIFSPLLGVGIFTADGKAWEHSRAALRPQFVRDQVSDLDLEERHVQNLFQHLPVNAATGWTAPTDLAPVFFRLTIDSATEFLFGDSINSQTAALAQARFGSTAANSQSPLADNSSDMAAAFDHGTAVLGTRFRIAWLYWLYSPPSFRKAIRVVHRFADDCIERAAAKRQGRNDKDDNDRYIFLDEMLKVTDDRVELRSQLLNILLAGRDTTAGLLGWTFWELARHPEVFRKLRATILESFGPYSDEESAKKQITFAALKSCTYLQHVMNEVLRLYPSVPMNLRQATRDTTLPRGGGPDGLSPVYVRRGQEVNYSVYVMHRRHDLWGPDADEFVPERWTGRRPGWEYLPFNGGPRVCLGQQFALTEAGYVICRMLQRFDAIEKAADFSDEELHSCSLTTAPVAVSVRLHQAVDLGKR